MSETASNEFQEARAKQEAPNDARRVRKATWHDPYGSYGDDKAEAHPFWETPGLKELARSQRVQPMTDVEALFGTWPGEEDDGFELAIDQLRHPKQE